MKLHSSGWCKAGCAAALVAWVSAQTVSAQDASPDHPLSPRLAKYDTNHDGKLDDNERAALKADREKKLLAKYDANHDGKLDDNERAAAKADRVKAREERHARLLAKYDVNHDGKLDPSELAAAKADRAKHSTE